jgi:hypothetical protein
VTPSRIALTRSCLSLTCDCGTRRPDA